MAPTHYPRRDFPVLAFAIAAVVLVAGALTGYLSVRHLIANDRLVAHTDGAMIHLASLLSSLKDAETGQRGYLLTGNETYLEPYRDGTAQIQREFASLSRELAPAQQARLVRLRALTARKLEELERTLSLDQAGARAAALAIVQGNAGQALMDQIRAQVGAMQTAEYALLDRRAQESERSSRRIILAILASTVIAGALLVLVFYLSRRSFQLQQRAAAQIAAERERLRVTLGSIGDAVLTTDRDCRITFANPVAEAVTGWSAQEMLQQPLESVFRIVNERTRATVENPARRAIRDAAVMGLTNHTALIRRDGSERPIDDSAAPIFDAEGRVLGCVLVFRDVSERRHAEQQHAEEAARFRSVVDHSADGIVTIDEHGTIEMLNPAAERLFGYSCDEVIGRNSRMLMPEPYQSAQDTYLAEHGPGGTADSSALGREVEGLRKDGSTVPLELAVSAFSVGGRRYFTAIVRDITRRKRMEQQTYEMMIELKEADRHKDEFLALLAHELRGPLAPLRNGLELIKRGRGADERLRWTGASMERQLDQLVRLVNDLLDASRIARGKIELRREPIELGGLLAELLDVERPAIEAADLTLGGVLPEEPLFVDADPVRLTQVFRNLLQNARKYSEPGGRIELRAEREADQILVRVKDTGIGIPPNELEAIFEMFIQVDPSRERSQGGLGIGLALAKRLTEMHGGSLTASSEGLGRGSEFLLRMPLSAAGSGRRSSASGDVPELAPRRILIVDDNADSAVSMAMLLELSRHETYTAHDGLEALKAAERLQPDVVLLDLGLPRLDGYEVCRRIRLLPWAKNVRVVAITGWGQEQDRQRTKAAGFDAHIVKPPDYAALLQAIAPPPQAAAQDASASGTVGMN